EAAPATAPQTPAPVDPRDATIRHLQLGLSIVSVVAVILAAAVVFLALRTVDSDNAPTTAGTSTPNSTASATPTQAPLYFTKYVGVNSEAVKPGAIVFELHTDYQCPWCGRAEQIYGEALSQLSKAGDIDLRIHIRTLIGSAVIGNDSSERAAIAALCANRGGHFWEYHSAIFANQPEEGVGFTDDQLRVDFAGQAGLTGQELTDFQGCYDSQATSSEVDAMEQEGVAAGVSGTPTFFVNGVKMSLNLQTTTPVSATDLLAGLKQAVGQ
ncbi:MAG: DsbA family protein, partial [Propionibacteriaceae bacterium]|nr:DsbA family protein [Propionibacteriaceae bacterium]